jgi:hypothetical protein
MEKRFKGEMERRFKGEMERWRESSRINCEV